MEFFETNKLLIRASYNIESRITKGTIFSKIEDPKKMIKVAVVDINAYDHMDFYILKEYTNRSYIAEDFEKLKQDLQKYAKLWNDRAEHTRY